MATPSSTLLGTLARTRFLIRKPFTQLSLSILVFFSFESSFLNSYPEASSLKSFLFQHLPSSVIVHWKTWVCKHQPAIPGVCKAETVKPMICKAEAENPGSARLRLENLGSKRL